MVGDHRRHRKLNPRPTLWLLSTKRMGAEAGRLHPAFRPEHGLYQKSARAPFDWLLIHKKTKSLEVIFGYQLQMRRHLRLMFGTCVLCFRLGEKSLCRSFCNHALPFLHFCIRETTERKKNPGLLSAPQRLCPMLPSYGPGLRATPNLRKPPPTPFPHSAAIPVLSLPEQDSTRIFLCGHFQGFSVWFLFVFNAFVITASTQHI